MLNLIVVKLYKIKNEKKNKYILNLKKCIRVFRFVYVLDRVPFLVQQIQRPESFGPGTHRLVLAFSSIFDGFFFFLYIYINIVYTCSVHCTRYIITRVENGNKITESGPIAVDLSRGVKQGGKKK